MPPPRPVAMTMGEPAGIGGEIALAAWHALHRDPAAAFFLIDDPARLTSLAEAIGRPTPVRAIADPADAVAAFATALPVLALEAHVAATPGRASADTAGTVLASIDRAVALAQAGAAAGVVTNPIHKGILYAAGFRHPGHTEYLASLVPGRPRSVMMLAIEGLRVVPATVHLALRDVADALTTDDLVEIGTIVAADLTRRFGIAAPRLAVAALNPHAGEDGAFGDEESRVIAPAIARLVARGVEAWGPAPADTLFHPAARQQADAVLCMYHDQALIPLKTLDFSGGVNVTLGLPFIRTSPDHGTAFDIAGTGTADPTSLIQSVKLAHRMACTA